MEPVIILAGGLGLRLRNAVPDLPKPMAPIVGRPFLEYQLDYWIDQGADRFILAVGYRHEAITGHFGNTYRRAAVEYVIERTPLGTGGGLLLAMSQLQQDAPFVLLNGDTFFAVDLPTLRGFAQANEADWCLSLFRTTDKERYGCIDLSPQGRVQALGGTTVPSSQLVNGGVYYVQPRALRSLPLTAGEAVSLEAQLLPSAIAAGHRVFGLEVSSVFIDIGVPSDFLRAQSLLVGRSQDHERS